MIPPRNGTNSFHHGELPPICNRNLRLKMQIRVISLGTRGPPFLFTFLPFHLSSFHNTGHFFFLQAPLVQVAYCSRCRAMNRKTSSLRPTLVSLVIHFGCESTLLALQSVLLTPASLFFKDSASSRKYSSCSFGVYMTKDPSAFFGMPPMKWKAWPSQS